MNILIIDDDLLLRKAVSYHLLEAGHSVAVASNGQEALALIDKNRNIDLVMVDVMMPVLTGPSFILSLKQYFHDKLPAIVIISGVRDGEEFLRKIEIPYDLFLPKPLNFEKLHAFIGSHEGVKDSKKTTV